MILTSDFPRESGVHKLMDGRAEMEVGMGEGAIAGSFPWDMWDIRDFGHLTEKVRGFKMFLP